MRSGVVALLLGAALAGCTSSTAQAPVAPVAVESPAPAVLPSPTTAPATLAPTRRPTATRAPVRRPALVSGADVSWPQCPVGTPGALPQKQGKGLPMPEPSAQFVVVGLTNGPGFHPNPCLALQVSQTQRLRRAAYAFTTLPTAAQTRTYGGRGPYSSRTSLGRLQNASWAQAQVNLASLRRVGLRTPIVWIDVEPQPLAPWSDDPALNRASLVAARKAYADAGYRTGWYSAPYAWQPITGGWRSPDPVWVTAGSRGRAEAERRCTQPSFSGGPVALSQHWTDTADYDVTCALARQHPERFFS